MLLRISVTLFLLLSNQYNKLGLNDRVTFRMQLKKLVSHVKAGTHTFVFTIAHVCVLFVVVVSTHTPLHV